MEKKFKRLVFHKGRNSKKIPNKKIDYDFKSVSNLSHWPSALMFSLEKYFDEIVYLHSVPNVKDTRHKDRLAMSRQAVKLQLTDWNR